MTVFLFFCETNLLIKTNHKKKGIMPHMPLIDVLISDIKSIDLHEKISEILCIKYLQLLPKESDDIEEIIFGDFQRLIGAKIMKIRGKKFLMIVLRSVISFIVTLPRKKFKDHPISYHKCSLSYKSCSLQAFGKTSCGFALGMGSVHAGF
ncbi:hypothetical protein RhiirA5_377284 [Rhizophagus irregularis]|uniref:Uncharacterized protein n=1 Tax=Rhizophagus irregularis TaxID=588596 RepID=A0A2N0PK08_9GLOM|nr:hypothetical protein RhiirA5_377284 [Rhizophagus irregularis]